MNRIIWELVVQIFINAVRLTGNQLYRARLPGS
jgi:hypothetical protein